MGEETIKQLTRATCGYMATGQSLKAPARVVA